MLLPRQSHTRLISIQLPQIQMITCHTFTALTLTDCWRTSDTELYVWLCFWPCRLVCWHACCRLLQLWNTVTLLRSCGQQGKIEVRCGGDIVDLLVYCSAVISKTFSLCVHTLYWEYRFCLLFARSTVAILFCWTFLQNQLYKLYPQYGVTKHKQ